MRRILSLLGLLWLFAPVPARAADVGYAVGKGLAAPAPVRREEARPAPVLSRGSPAARGSLPGTVPVLAPSSSTRAPDGGAARAPARAARLDRPTPSGARSRARRSAALAAAGDLAHALEGGANLQHDLPPPPAG